MSKLLLTFAAAAALATPALAQPADTCRAPAAAIEAGLKDLSYDQARDQVDDSAPRAQVRAAHAAAVYGMIQANIALLQAGHCPLPPGPFSADVYKVDATKCVTGWSESSKPGSACDRASWRPAS